MSAIDVLRSFAEAREPDDAVVRSGITYGDCREILARIGLLEKAVDGAFSCKCPPPMQRLDKPCPYDGPKEMDCAACWRAWAMEGEE